MSDVRCPEVGESVNESDSVYIRRLFAMCRAGIVRDPDGPCHPYRARPLSTNVVRFVSHEDGILRNRPPWIGHVEV